MNWNDLLFLLLFAAVLSTALSLLLVALAWPVFLLRRIIASKPIPRPFLMTNALVVSFALGLWIWPVRPFLHRGRQVRTFVNMNTVVHHLSEYKQLHGQYPDQLSAMPSDKGIPLTDAWGNPLQYSSDEVGFLLVSFGKNGKAEFHDYSAICSAGGSPTNVTGDWDADQVVTDQGWCRRAGK